MFQEIPYYRSIYMAAPSHVTDQIPPPGQAPPPLERPLILDQMPSSDKLTSRPSTPDSSRPSTPDASASARPDSNPVGRPDSSPVGRPAPSADQPPLTKTSADSPGQGAFLDITPLNYGSTQPSIARPVENGAAKPGEKPDPFKLNESKLDQLVQTAAGLVGKDLTIAPPGTHAGKIPKALGCAASISNVLIKDHEIGIKDFNINVDGLEKMLKDQKGATMVKAADLRPGDIVVGRDEKGGSDGRHVGIVGLNAQGQLVAFNNNDGRFASNGLKDRFLDKYRQVYGLRLPSS
jgi:hypothetical protein